MSTRRPKMKKKMPPQKVGPKLLREKVSGDPKNCGGKYKREMRMD